jgi:bacteriorhodopsin
MLSNLEAPYRYTMAGLVFIVLGTGVASFLAEAPASYAWFAISSVIFLGTYYSIIVIVRERLEFFKDLAHKCNGAASIKYLKLSCYVFFSVWMVYPILWILGSKGFGIMSGI